MDYFKIAHILHLFPSESEPITGSDMYLLLSSVVANCINTTFGVRHVDCAGMPAPRPLITSNLMQRCGLYRQVCRPWADFCWCYAKKKKNPRGSWYFHKVYVGWKEQYSNARCYLKSVNHNVAHNPAYPARKINGVNGRHCSSSIHPYFPFYQKFVRNSQSCC
jgi:hypothetical protein